MSSCQLGRCRLRPAGHVGENQIGPDAVLCQKHEVGAQVLGLVVGLADAGVSIGYYDQVAVDSEPARCSTTPVGWVEGKA